MAITERVDRQNAESAKFESADLDLEPLSHILTNPLSPLQFSSPLHCTPRFHTTYSKYSILHHDIYDLPYNLSYDLLYDFTRRTAQIQKY